jgi:hypothetical protein
MSSPGLPTLTVDARSRRCEARVALLALGFAGAAPLGLTGLDFPATVAASVASILVIGAGLWRAGWLPSRRRLAAFVWHADGRWVLTDVCNMTFEGRLCADARIGERCVWLRWQAGSQRLGAERTMLLARGDVADRELRRLITRLGIEGRHAFRDPRRESQARSGFSANFPGSDQSIGAAPAGRSGIGSRTGLPPPGEAGR